MTTRTRNWYEIEFKLDSTLLKFCVVILSHPKNNNNPANEKYPSSV